MIIGISGKIGSGKDTVGKIIQWHTYGPWTNLEGTPQKGAPYEITDWLNGISDSHPSNTWVIKKYAAKLKKVVSLLTGIPVCDFEKQEVKDSFLGSEWSKKLSGDWESDGQDKEYRITVRGMLQRVGTEAMRNTIHENVWVNALFADYKEKFNSIHTLVDPKVFEGEDYKEDWTKSFPNWIITDVRFPNEATAIKERDGILIRINRPLEHFIPAGDGILGQLSGTDRHQHPSETSLDSYKFDHIITNDNSIESLINKVESILQTEKII